MSTSDIFKKDMRDKLDYYSRLLGFSNFNDRKTTEKGYIFLRYFLYEFFANEYLDVSEDDLDGGVIDGANDLGIDFIYDDDSAIVVIQAKYGVGQITREVISDFQLLPSRIRDRDYIKRKANKYLLEVFSGISNVQAKPIRLILLSDQKVIEKEIIESTIESAEKDVDCIVYDFETLKQEFVRLSSQEELPPQTIDLSIGGEDFFEFDTVDSNYPTVLLTQKGTKLKNLYNRYHESLFSLNIRYWLGRNPVNKEMVKTIENEPERFFYYNNGITAVCDSFETLDTPNGRIVRCENLQIINGAQTFTTISRDNSPGLENVKVLIKLIEAEKGKARHDESGLNESIVRNTNNQTAITVSDFRSNDEIQHFLETAIKKIEYRGISPHRKLFYRRKRSKVPGHKNDLVVSMQDLGKAFYSSFYNPVELNAAVGRLWDNKGKGLYYFAFGNDGQRSSVLNQSRIYAMLCAYFFYDFVKEHCKGRDKKTHPSVLFKYHISFGIVELVKAKHPFEGQVDKLFEQIIEKGICLNSHLWPDSYKKFEQYFESVADNIDFLVAEKEKEGALVMRNLQRNTNFLEQVTRYIKAPAIMKSLPELL